VKSHEVAKTPRSARVAIAVQSSGLVHFELEIGSRKKAITPLIVWKMPLALIFVSSRLRGSRRVDVHRHCCQK
jgi:hypothetical protein